MDGMVTSFPKTLADFWMMLHPAISYAWCQQLPKLDFQTWTLVVPPALEKSGLPAFLPVSDRLFLQESLLKSTRLERDP